MIDIAYMLMLRNRFLFRRLWLQIDDPGENAGDHDCRS